MIRPIILLGDPLLSQVSVEISESQKADIHMLIEDLFETMHKANGVGLAAVQIGVPIRVFVIEAHMENEDFHFRGAFINPKILREWGDQVKHPEGCLSVPGLAGIVERPENIEMEWYDENWEYHKKTFDGYAARIIQHEYDHLEGKVYVDYLDTMWKKALERPLENIRNREFEELHYAWK